MFTPNYDPSTWLVQSKPIQRKQVGEGLSELGPEGAMG